ncbi:MAG TPA: hypothetical protein PLG20_10015, partial [Candidatus Syntrophosphaera sp.]|nr:hypothetical protein [Candidatus Syntrophosphaera sp.]
NSIDLMWSNPSDAVKNHIWRLNYAAVAGAGAYPAYNPLSFSPFIPFLDPSQPSPQNGWTLIASPAATTFFTDSGMERGYYYYAVYTEDEAGNISGNPMDGPYYRESISYWPGDVTSILGSVDIDDVGILAAAWGTQYGDPAFNSFVDVGPTIAYNRRSRPIPDQVIDIEDMMIFAMNYHNTSYTVYPRYLPEPNPVSVAMNVRRTAALVTATVDLAGNSGFVKGLNVPVSYGSGLQLVSIENGAVWPEGSLLLHTDSAGVVEISGSVLGGDAVIAGDGTVLTLTFNVTGEDNGLALQEITARSWDNREIEVSVIPGTTSNDDLVNPIPVENFLAANRPNPFTNGTTLGYGLKEAGSVRISVFNSRGGQVSSGIYFFRLEAKGTVKVQKGLLIK